MSDQDEVKPFHAKDVSTGQEAADAVADVLKHAAARDVAALEADRKAAPKGNPRWMLPLAMNLGVLAVYFLVAQPRWLEVNPIQPQPTERQVEQLRNAIYFHGISRIEGFRLTHGRLPTTLEEAGATSLTGQVDYVVRGDSTYALIGNVGEAVVSFDSAMQTPDQFVGTITLPG
jgi:hypothetical protein